MIGHTLSTVSGAKALHKAGVAGLMALALLAVGTRPAMAETVPEEVENKNPGPRGSNKNDRTGRVPLPADNTLPVLSSFREYTPKLNASAVMVTKEKEAREFGGEQLVYDIWVNGVRAGKAQMDIVGKEAAKDGAMCYTVSFRLLSNRAFSLFYKVNNKATSKIDVNGGFSRFYTVDNAQEKEKSQETFVFNYTTMPEAVCDSVRLDGQTRTYSLKTGGKVLDPLSAIYYMRSVDLTALANNRNTLVLPICSDHRLNLTKIQAGTRSYEDIGDLKNRACLMIEPDCEFRGLFYRKSKMRIWLDMATGVVVKLAVETAVGPAEAKLTEHYNSPLDAPATGGK